MIVFYYVSLKVKVSHRFPLHMQYLQYFSSVLLLVNLLGLYDQGSPRSLKTHFVSEIGRNSSILSGDQNSVGRAFASYSEVRGFILSDSLLHLANAETLS